MRFTITEELRDSEVLKGMLTHAFAPFFYYAIKNSLSLHQLWSRMGWCATASNANGQNFFCPCDDDILQTTTCFVKIGSLFCPPSPSFPSSTGTLAMHEDAKAALQWLFDTRVEIFNQEQNKKDLLMDFDNRRRYSHPVLFRAHLYVYLNSQQCFNEWKLLDSLQLTGIAQTYHEQARIAQTYHEQAEKSAPAYLYSLSQLMIPNLSNMYVTFFFSLELLHLNNVVRIHERVDNFGMPVKFKILEQAKFDSYFEDNYVSTRKFLFESKDSLKELIKEVLIRWEPVGGSTEYIQIEPLPDDVKALLPSASGSALVQHQQQSTNLDSESIFDDLGDFDSSVWANEPDQRAPQASEQRPASEQTDRRRASEQTDRRRASESRTVRRQKLVVQPTPIDPEKRLQLRQTLLKRQRGSDTGNDGQQLLQIAPPENDIFGVMHDQNLFVAFWGAQARARHGEWHAVIRQKSAAGTPLYLSHPMQNTEAAFYFTLEWLEMTGAINITQRISASQKPMAFVVNETDLQAQVLVNYKMAIFFELFILMQDQISTASLLHALQIMWLGALKWGLDVGASNPRSLIVLNGMFEGMQGTGGTHIVPMPGMFVQGAVFHALDSGLTAEQMRAGILCVIVEPKSKQLQYTTVDPRQISNSIRSAAQRTASPIFTTASSSSSANPHGPRHSSFNSPSLAAAGRGFAAAGRGFAAAGRGFAAAGSGFAAAGSGFTAAGSGSAPVYGLFASGGSSAASGGSAANEGSAENPITLDSPPPSKQCQSPGGAEQCQSPGGAAQCQSPGGAAQPAARSPAASLRYFTSAPAELNSPSQKVDGDFGQGQCGPHNSGTSADSSFYSSRRRNDSLFGDQYERMAQTPSTPGF